MGIPKVCYTLLCFVQEVAVCDTLDKKDEEEDEELDVEVTAQGDDQLGAGI